jgi:hypothetical protein
MTEPEAPPLDVDAELDRIYQLPATAFVAERNKVAQSLRKSGNGEEAARIARLPRPAPVAWLINQLHFRDRPCLDTLLEAGAELRHAQESAASAAEFTERQREHQRTLRAAMESAWSFAAAGGLTRTPVLQRRLELNLSLLSAADTALPAPPGRMSAELQPLGFDALGHVAAPQPRTEPKRKSKPEDAERLKQLDELKGAVDAADKDVRPLEREAERCRAHHDRAVRDVEEAERRAEAARTVRDDAGRATEAASERLSAARQALDQARRKLEEQSRHPSPGF